MIPEQDPPVEDRLVVAGSLAFLLGTAAAAFLYALDPYQLSLELFLLSPRVSWPFYLGSIGLVSLASGGALARYR